MNHFSAMTLHPSTQHILIVEDTLKLGQLLIDYLHSEGFQTHWLTDGQHVLPYIETNSPDLILLDLMLPGCDGLTLCREIRRLSDIPIMIVTAKIEEVDRLLGLELGADDYICKPFSPREVVARVKTILRRCAHRTSRTAAVLLIDESRFQVSFNQHALELTPAEFRLLKTLATQPERVFSREELLNHLYDDYRVVTDRTVDSHIKNLRRKLGPLGEEGELFIRSVYGIGYRWENIPCRLL